MAGKTSLAEGLQPLQLQHWIRAVKSGGCPSVTDPETGITRELPLPLARSDGGGLTFTLSSTGTASWILRYRTAGRAKELTIGNFPDIGLADARKIAREKRSEIDKSGDPAIDKRRVKALALKAWTVRELIDDYRDKIMSGLGASTQKGYGRNLGRIQSRLGSYMVTQVSALDIVELIESVGAPWVESRTLLTTARMLFRHAAGRKLVATNPCIGIELSALMGKRPATKRRLMLNRDELLLLMGADMNRENALAVRVLLATAVRSGELRMAKWSHFDFKRDIWSIPESKTGPGIQIPLTEPVKIWLDEMKKLARDSAFVLPARGDYKNASSTGDRPINPNTIGSAIEFWLTEHTPNVRRFTPHDLRSTAKSQMRALGVARDITEMCLNHKLPGIEGIYDVHNYFEERRQALLVWSNFLLSVERESIAQQKKK
ncbi:UNVERIFIED_ORG: integrase [Zoogloea ramigera]|uniref:Tyrosine-type recombinase/integrase n=1 Tax=Duganella zoogloeoides TaxID=75659 RepID=A0ABZ0Y058_9BURK|nr:site-specific integrase [Duganella zoogloeoides]WQH05412.1 tyrosine-type recombinase/integrase [Duganella zoogloeoides]